MNTNTAEIIKWIRQIPKGKVSTYGTIAMLAGNPRGARQVSWVLHSQSEKERLPWYRVVNRLGKISIPESSGYRLQKALLEKEGVVFDSDDRIDLREFGF